MAPTNSHHASKGGNIKKGICENHSYLNPDTGETGDCPKCASGEIMSIKVQRLSDFRCPVCEGKLTLVKEKNTKKIALIAGGVVAAAAIAVGITVISGKEKTEIEEAPVVVDTIPTASADTVVAESVETAVNVTKPETVTTEEPKAATVATPKSVLGGAAVLVNEGSYKTLRFKRDYDLDLGKADGSTLHISAGEEINNAHITNGKLRGGNYRNRSGEEQGLHGLSVTL